MPQADLQPRTALIVLTALNLLNYADRNVLFAVQPLVQDEFHLTNTQLGYLTSAFLGFYMIAAPFVGPLADRYSRKLIIVLGALFWSGLTLLTAVTHTYTELLVRHTLVGVGEATFVTIAPTFVADLFEEKKRGRILGVFYLAIPVGSAAGYLLGGYLAPNYGWRFPFYIAAAPGFLLALAVLFLKEPERGQFDSLKETPERGTVLGLARNPAFLTATLGMAAMTFSLGGIQVWIPKFLFSERHYTLEAANFAFGIIIVVDGILAALAGGWLGDYLLPRLKGSYYLVSAASMAAGSAGHDCGLVCERTGHDSGDRGGGVFSAAEHRTAECGRDQFCGSAYPRHGDGGQYFHHPHSGRCAFADDDGMGGRQASLQAAFVLPVIAMGISSAILFYGMRFAPPVAVDGAIGSSQPQGSIFLIRMDWHTFIGLRERFWRLAWFSRIVDAALGMPSVADVSRPEWDRNPVSPAGNPRVSIIVPARNEEESIEQALNTLLALDYDNYEVIAVNDRSTDRTGEIMERVAEKPHFSQRTREMGHCPLYR